MYPRHDCATVKAVFPILGLVLYKRATRKNEEHNPFKYQRERLGLNFSFHSHLFNNQMAMHIAIVCLLAVAVSVSAEADPQFGYGVPAVYPYDAFYPDQPSYFRAGMPLTSFENQKPENRLFFGTVTFTLATTTSTSIITTSTTCTTSASAISICSPAARRRRDFLLGAKKGRLFYSDDNEEEDSIFYKSPYVSITNLLLFPLSNELTKLISLQRT